MLRSIAFFRSGSRQDFRWYVAFRRHVALPGKLAEGSFSDPPGFARAGEAGGGSGGSWFPWASRPRPHAVATSVAVKSAIFNCQFTISPFLCFPICRRAERRRDHGMLTGAETLDEFRYGEEEAGAWERGESRLYWALRFQSYSR